MGVALALHLCIHCARAIEASFPGKLWIFGPKAGPSIPLNLPIIQGLFFNTPLLRENHLFLQRADKNANET